MGVLVDEFACKHVCLLVCVLLGLFECLLACVRTFGLAWKPACLWARLLVGLCARGNDCVQVCFFACGHACGLACGWMVISEATRELCCFNSQLWLLIIGSRGCKHSVWGRVEPLWWWAVVCDSQSMTREQEESSTLTFYRGRRKHRQSNFVFHSASLLYLFVFYPWLWPAWLGVL